MPLPYPRIPAGFGLARLEFNMNGADHDPAIIFGYTDDGVDSAQTSASNICANFGGTVVGFLSNQIGLNNCHIVRNNGGTLEEGDSIAGSFGGGVVADSLTANVSILMHKGTGVIGKKFRGRMYVPALPKNHADASGSTIVGANLSDLQTAATNFLSALAVEPGPMVLLHRDIAVAPTVVTLLTVEARLATQSRRLRKVAHR